MITDQEAIATVLAKVRDFGDDHWYRYPLTEERVPSVTTILSATHGKPWLVPWGARLSAEYCVEHRAELARLIRKEGEHAAVELAKKQAAVIRELKADAGTYVHKVAEALVLWQASPKGAGGDLTLPLLPGHLEDVFYDDEPLPVVVDWMIGGFLNWVSAFQPQFEAAEMTVFSMTLGVAGTLDMIVRLNGVALAPGGRLVPAPGQSVLLCVDIKTGKILDQTVPEQISAYRKMEEALLPLGDLVPMPATDAGAVLHLRPEHRDGYRLMIVSQTAGAAAWNRFRRAVELHHGRGEAGAKPGPVAYMPRADGTAQPPFVSDLDGEGWGRVPGALTKALGDAVDVEELACLTAAECLALKGIGDKSLPVIRAMLAAHDLHLADESPASTGKEAA